MELEAEDQGGSTLPPPSSPTVPDVDPKAFSESILHQAFNLSDKDGSGFLTDLEFSLVLRRVLPTMARKDISRQMRLVDKNHDGKISFQEFLTWLRKEAQVELAEAIRQETCGTPKTLMTVFRLLDFNDSGTITEKELRRFVDRTCPNVVSDEKWPQLMRAIDKNGDGVVDYSEFVRFMFHSQESIVVDEPAKHRPHHRKSI